MLSADTSKLNNGDTVKLEGKRYNIKKIATAESPYFIFKEIDIQGVSSDNTIKINAETLSVVNSWDVNTKFDISMITHSNITNITDKERQTIKSQFNDLVKSSELELFNLKSKVKRRQPTTNSEFVNEFKKHEFRLLE